MGVEVRTKDKAVIVAAVPIVLLAAYWHFWRADAAKCIDALERRSAALVTVEDFPVQKLSAERRLADSEEELQREKSVAWPEKKVRDCMDESFAERERKVLAVLRDSGLTVLRSEAVQRGAAASEDAGEVIRHAVSGEMAGSRRGWTAEVRRYTLEGNYSAVKRALDVFSCRQMAVVTTKVEMRDAGRGRWTLEVWL